MHIHTVARGECLSSIAKSYGFARWQTIYNHPDNQAFRQKRPNPNIIYAGDALTIPDRELYSVDRSTDDTHRFVLMKQRTLLSLVVQDASGKPLDGKKYKLQVTGRSKPYLGVVGRNGLVEIEIEPDASEGHLTVYAAGGGYTWPLDIGDLDPIETPSGIAGRLRNLAYDVPHDPSPEELQSALATFQLDHKIPVTAKLDSATREKLVALHDESQADVES